MPPALLLLRYSVQAVAMHTHGAQAAFTWVGQLGYSVLAAHQVLLGLRSLKAPSLRSSIKPRTHMRSAHTHAHWYTHAHAHIHTASPRPCSAMPRLPRVCRVCMHAVWPERSRAPLQRRLEHLQRLLHLACTQRSAIMRGHMGRCQRQSGPGSRHHMGRQEHEVRPQLQPLP